MPTNKDGECENGAKAVTTPSNEIFEWVSTWNVDGTRHGAPYNAEPDWFSRLLRALFIRDAVVSGEGNDEIINWSCLCLKPNTGEVRPAEKVYFDPEPAFDFNNAPFYFLNGGAG